MFVHSRQVGLAYSAWSAPVQDGPVARPAANSAAAEEHPWVRISAAARLAQQGEASPPAGGRAEFDTDRGRREIDIGQYFSGQRQHQGEQVTLRDSLPPLLLPTQRNIDALSAHLGETLPRFLADNQIPTAPASLRYDGAGKLQLPADYPYARELQNALQKNPAMARELSTLNALASQVGQLNRLIPFNQEYAAARTPGEAAAVVAKYSDLFSERRQPVDTELVLSPDGKPSMRGDGQY